MDLKNEETNEEILNAKKHNIILNFSIFVFIFFSILVIIYSIFTIINLNNTHILKGISIQNVDISNLTKDEAYTKVCNYINSYIPDEFIFVTDDFEMPISTSQLEINYKIKEAVDFAYSIGRNQNPFENNLITLKCLFTKINIDPSFSVNQANLNLVLEDISTKLPNKSINSGYYIEDNNLILTKGTPGFEVDISRTSNNLINYLTLLNAENNKIKLVLKEKYPEILNFDLIYSEVKKEAKNAYYTKNPFYVYPSEEGLDFAIPFDEAKNIFETSSSNECTIPLQIVYPTITTNMIGTEAFPDLLANFSTNYNQNDKNRTTNLILSSNKINGTVVLPGETFSYNKTVGARTIAAGYKEAPIYVNNTVQNGLGGGICQIATTLYNAALYANLEIVERSNHQFVPSYSPASRDATVVYGAIDFKFKNNRDFPIKIVCSVNNGIANFKIFGLKTPDDYDVEITSKIIRRASSSIYSEAYKTLSKDGNIIKTELLSKDVYKTH